MSVLGPPLTGSYRRIRLPALLTPALPKPPTSTSNTNPPNSHTEHQLQCSPNVAQLNGSFRPALPSSKFDLLLSKQSSSKYSCNVRFHQLWRDRYLSNAPLNPL